MKLDINILIVDDFVTMRKTMKHILKKIGFSMQNVCEASNTVDALKMLEEKEHIDLIISDWNMPGIKGIDFLRTIRKRKDRYKDIPFVMVTAEAQAECVLEAVKAGVTNYIVKPFTIAAVTDKLEKVLGK